MSRVPETGANARTGFEPCVERGRAREIDRAFGIDRRVNRLMAATAGTIAPQIMMASVADLNSGRIG